MWNEGYRVPKRAVMLCETLHGGNSIRLNSTKLTTLRLQYQVEEYFSTCRYITLV